MTMQLPQNVLNAFAQLATAIPRASRVALKDQFDILLRGFGSSIEENQFLVGRRPLWNNEKVSQPVRLFQHDIRNCLAEFSNQVNSINLGPYIGSINEMAKFLNVTPRTIENRIKTHAKQRRPDGSPYPKIPDGGCIIFTQILGLEEKAETFPLISSALTDINLRLDQSSKFNFPKKK